MKDNQESKKKSYISLIIISIVAIILFATLPFHYFILGGWVNQKLAGTDAEVRINTGTIFKIYPKLNLTFSNTFVFQEDINMLIERHNNASWEERQVISAEPLYRVLIEKGFIETEEKKIINEENVYKDNSNEENNKPVVDYEIPITSDKVTCTEKETKNEDEGGPILTKTCLYKTYKTISKGFPDYKGRYSYEYSVFKKQENGSYVQIKNASMFNKNKNELLSIINSKIEKDYKSFSNEAKDCFEGASFTPFNFDQLGITFNND
jgi:hypothetical protein